MSYINQKWAIDTRYNEFNQKWTATEAWVQPEESLTVPPENIA